MTPTDRKQMRFLIGGCNSIILTIRGFSNVQAVQAKERHFVLCASVNHKKVK